MKQGLYVNVEDAANLAASVFKAKDCQQDVLIELLKEASPLFVTESGNIIHNKDM